MTEYIVSNGKYAGNVKLLNDHKLEYDGKVIEYKIEKVNKYCYLLKLDNKVHEVLARKINSGSYEINLHGNYINLEVRTKLQERARQLLKDSGKNSGVNILKAPMPGMILRINKNVGESVETGESLFVLEAMKMENEIKSTVSGVVKELKIKPGSKVEKGEILLIIESQV